MMTVGMIVGDRRGFAAFNKAFCKAVRVRHERKHGYNDGSPRPPAKHSMNIAQFLMWWAILPRGYWADVGSSVEPALPTALAAPWLKQLAPHRYNLRK